MYLYKGLDYMKQEQSFSKPEANNTMIINVFEFTEEKQHLQSLATSFRTASSYNVSNATNALGLFKANAILENSPKLNEGGMSHY